jgi:flagellar basal-body rod modification protein FlgD
MTAVSSTTESLGIAQNSNSARKDKLGQEDFLMLMTTQLQNQDPFKPMENGEFLGQMAQFGTVSGIEDLQKSFSTLAGSMYSNQALQVAGLVGKTVAVESNVGHLADGGTMQGSIGIPTSASDVAVSVYDQSGALVRRMSLGPQGGGLAEFTWDGKASDGSALPAGNYQVVAEATMGDEIIALPTLIEAEVKTVSFGPNGQNTSLELAGLGNWDFSEVRQIKNGSDAATTQSDIFPAQ